MYAIVTRNLNEYQIQLEFEPNDPDADETSVELIHLSFILPESKTAGKTDEELDAAGQAIADGIQAAIDSLSGL